MIKMRKENVAVAVHPNGKQVNPEFSIETTEIVNANDVTIAIKGGPGSTSELNLLPAREVRKDEDNYYTLTFEALVDNSKSDVEIQVTVRNERGEEDSEIITISKNPYA